MDNDSSQDHQYIGAYPVFPPTLAVTNKVNRLLTLSRVCSWKSSTFVLQGTSRPTSKDQAHDGIRLSCHPDTIPARAPLGHPTPYLLRTPVDSGAYLQVNPGGITL